MQVVLQLEKPAGALSYVPVTAAEVGKCALALARCWQTLGVLAGDRVLIFDYGSSPTVLFASSLYAPLLRRGAAERLGCQPVCNDGVASMAPRAVQIVRQLRPGVVFLRADVLPAFAMALEEAGVSLSQHVRSVVVTQEEGILPAAERERLESQWAVPVHRMLRLDAALFLAPECPVCRLFHTWPDLYRVQKEGRRLTVAASFAPHLSYASSLAVELVQPGCPAAPREPRFRIGGGR